LRSSAANCCMAFSFSPRTELAAVGRNVRRIAFLVLLNLFLAITFSTAIAVRSAVTAAIAHQERAHGVERNNLIGVALYDCGARHSTDHAGVFALRHGHAPGGFDRPEAL